MRIGSAKVQNHLQQYKSSSSEERNDLKKPFSPKDKVEITTKKIEHFQVQENSPDNPEVSKKVLDSLNMGMINFNQKERDTLATIMANKAQEVSKRISQRS